MQASADFGVVVLSGEYYDDVTARRVKLDIEPGLPAGLNVNVVTGVNLCGYIDCPIRLVLLATQPAERDHGVDCQQYEC